METNLGCFLLHSFFAVGRSVPTTFFTAVTRTVTKKSAPHRSFSSGGKSARYMYCLPRTPLLGGRGPVMAPRARTASEGTHVTLSIQDMQLLLNRFVIYRYTVRTKTEVFTVPRFALVQSTTDVLNGPVVLQCPRCWVRRAGREVAKSLILEENARARSGNRQIEDVRCRNRRGAPFPR